MCDELAREAKNGKISVNRAIRGAVSPGVLMNAAWSKSSAETVATQLGLVEILSTTSDVTFPPHQLTAGN